MDPAMFQKIYKSISKNIEEVKEIANKINRYLPQDRIKLCEKAKYLFYGVAKSLVDIGNQVILENDFRPPINNADVFISLSEHEIIMPSTVPGIKKAVLAFPQIYGWGYDEFFALIRDCIDDLQKCLDSFEGYYNLKEKKD